MVASLLAGLGFALYRLDTPGLYYDELLFVNAALGGINEIFVERRVLGVPVLLMEYIGALKAWIHAPIFAVFGLTPLSIRVPSILLGAAGGGLLCAAVARASGATAGAIATLLLFTNPSFVGHLRVDWGPTDLMFLFRGALLFLGVSWVASPTPGKLWLAVLVLLAGIFDKLSFLWIGNAVILALLVVHGRVAGRFLRQHPWHGVAAGACVFALLLGATTRALEITREIQPDPTDWLVRARVVARLLRALLAGDGVMAFVGGTTARFPRLLLLGQLASIGLAVWALRRGAEPAERRALAFFALVSALVLAMLFLTPTATGPHHAALLLGLPQALLASLLGLRSARRSAGGRRVIATSLAVVGIAGLLVNAEQVRGFECPSVNFDPANLAAARFAVTLDDARIVNTDWGMGLQMVLASGGRMPIVDGQRIIREARSSAEILRLIDPGRDTYLFTRLAGAEAFAGNRDRLLETLAREGVKPVSVRRFDDCHGEPVIEVLEVPARAGPRAHRRPTGE